MAFEQHYQMARRFNHGEGLVCTLYAYHMVAERPGRKPFAGNKPKTEHVHPGVKYGLK
jgi:hypothetical protein